MQNTKQTCMATVTMAMMALPLLSSNAVAQEAAANRAGRPQPVYLFGLNFTCDASAVVTVGDCIRMHDVATGKLRHQRRLPRGARCVACSPVEPDLYATGSDDGIVRVWRTGHDEPLLELSKHAGFILDMQFSPDGTNLMSCGTLYEKGQASVGDVKLWETGTGRLLQSLEFAAAGAACVAFSSDGQHVAVSKNPAAENGDQTSTVELYDLNGWRHVRTIPFTPGFALDVEFTPTGDRLVIAGGVCANRTANGCNPTGKIWVGRLDQEQPAELIEVPRCEYFRSASLTPDGELCAVGTASSRPIRGGQSIVAEIQLRRLSDGAVVWSQDGEIGQPYGVQVSPDGQLVAGCSAGKILIFDVPSGKPVRVIDIEK